MATVFPIKAPQMRESVLKFRDDFIKNHLDNNQPYTITKEQIIQLHPKGGGGLLLQRKTFQITKQTSGDWKIENNEGAEISAVFEPVLNGYPFQIAVVYPKPFIAVASTAGDELDFSFTTPVQMNLISRPKNSDGSYISGFPMAQKMIGYTISSSAAVMVLQDKVNPNNQLILRFDFADNAIRSLALAEPANRRPAFLFGMLPKLTQHRLLSLGKAGVLAMASSSGACGKTNGGPTSYTGTYNVTTTFDPNYNDGTGIPPYPASLINVTSTVSIVFTVYLTWGGYGIGPNTGYLTGQGSIATPAWFSGPPVVAQAAVAKVSGLSILSTNDSLPK